MQEHINPQTPTTNKPRIKRPASTMHLLKIRPGVHPNPIFHRRVRIIRLTKIINTAILAGIGTNVA